MEKSFSSFFYIILIIVIIVIIGFYFFLRTNFSVIIYPNDTKEEIVEEKKPEDSEPRLLVVSDIKNKVPSIVSYGEEGVEILNFNLTANSIEDIELQGVAVTFSLGIYGEILNGSEIKNLYLVDEYGYVYSNADEGLSYLEEIAPDRSWGYRTIYAWFTGRKTIKKGTTNNFKLIIDIPNKPSFPLIQAILPDEKRVSESSFGDGISSYFKAKGVDSGKKPEITGSAKGSVYLRPENDIGSVLLFFDSSYNPVYPRISKEAILSKIDIFAGKEEDILLSKVGLRITNLVHGQFKNIRLVSENGIQYGKVIENPPIITGPNVVFYGDKVIKSGQKVRFNLVSDIEIPSLEESNYGTQLQREVVAFIATSESPSDWIVAKGLSSGKNVYNFGGVNTWLKFSE